MSLPSLGPVAGAQEVPPTPGYRFLITGPGCGGIVAWPSSYLSGLSFSLFVDLPCFFEVHQCLKSISSRGQNCFLVGGPSQAPHPPTHEKLKSE